MKCSLCLIVVGLGVIMVKAGHVTEWHDNHRSPHEPPVRRVWGLWMNIEHGWEHRGHGPGWSHHWRSHPRGLGHGQDGDKGRGQDSDKGHHQGHGQDNSQSKGHNHGQGHGHGHGTGPNRGHHHPGHGHHHPAITREYRYHGHIPSIGHKIEYSYGPGHGHGHHHPFPSTSGTRHWLENFPAFFGSDHGFNFGTKIYH